jgi:hypothetical protein
VDSLIHFEELTINHKELFNKYLRGRNSSASELCFTNFFIWRHYYNLKFAQILNYLCVISEPVNSEPFAFFPIGYNHDEDLQKCVLLLSEYFQMKKWRMQFKKVTTNDLIKIKELALFNIITEYDRNDSDYLYLTSDLIDLKGRKFDAKRNHINNFKKYYQYEYFTLTKDLAGDCVAILEEWYNNKFTLDHEYLFEKKAIFELLNNMDELECKGALVKVNDVPAAFAIGEKLNEETAVIHAEKAITHYKGLYAFINQQFCENELRYVKYVNREQDLGIDGLRKAKLSYNPIEILNKYKVIVL